MIRIPGKIPIAIMPAFWLFAAIISFFLSGGNILQTFVWVGIILFSVLFHEFGHALMARGFGLQPRIELVAMGGLTYHNGERLKFWKQFLITLNGPVFGFLIVIAAYLIMKFTPLPEGYLRNLIGNIFLINLIWTVVNVLPIMPLDGGQLLRIVLEASLHAKGLRITFMVSACLALACSLFFFLGQNIFAGAIFFLFAFENFDNFRKTKFIRESDRNADYKQELADAEQQMRLGNKEKALEMLEKIRAQTKEGIIYVAATQYAAFLEFEQGHHQQAYDELVSLKDRLDPEGLFLLHRLAFEYKNFSLVFDLAGAVFQIVPQAEVALRNAYAGANLGDVSAAIGWLTSALQCGVENLKEIIQEKDFDKIRTDPQFVEFLRSSGAE